jgi:hypothetical protein
VAQRGEGKGGSLPALAESEVDFETEKADASDWAEGSRFGATNVRSGQVEGVERGGVGQQRHPFGDIDARNHSELYLVTAGPLRRRPSQLRLPLSAEARQDRTR